MTTERKILLLIIFTGVTSLSIRAQGNYAYRYSMWNGMNYHQNYKYQYNNIDSYALASHIYTFAKTTRQYSKTGKVSVSNESFYFDRYGRCETRLYTHDTGSRSKVDYLMKRSFNASGQMSDNSYSNSKHNNFYQVFTYNDSDKLILATSFNDKKRIAAQTIIRYNPLGHEESVLYKGSRGKMLYSYHYHYFPDGKLKQTVLSGKRGKLIRVTDYSCDETGKTTRKIKDTAKICTVKSYLPDGSIVAVTQYFGYKGQPVKIVRVTDSGGLILKYEYYRGLKETLYYANLYSYSSGKIVKYENKGLDSKGQSFISTRIFDENGRIIKEEYILKVSGSRSIVTRTDYFYSENGLLTGETEYRNGKLKSESKLTYFFY